MRWHHLRHRPSSIVAILLVLAAAVLSLPSSTPPLSAGLTDQEQRDHRWYDNVYSPPDKPQPSTPLAAENTAITDVASGDVRHLRMNVHSGFNTDVPAGTAYKLQYSTSTGGPWTDLGGIGSAAIWRSFDNSGLTDGVQIDAVLLSSSIDKLNYEEENPGTSAGAIGKEKVVEWGWVVQDNGAADGTKYYFRMALNDGTALSSYINYPELTTKPPPSVTVTKSAGSTDVTEGGATDTYDVVLDVQPSGTVTITISPDSQVTTSPATLTFTTSNFGTPQTVTVTAINDAVVEGAHTSTITHNATGRGYDGVSIPNVVGNVTDNDIASVTVTEGGATDTYTVVLDLEPYATVTISVSPDADVSVETTTLTFTTGDWSAPQTVTVTAVDDAFVEGAHTGTITHSASGGSYDGVSISNVVANITDNDVGGVIVTESGGSTDVTEGGANDTYDVVLDSLPSGPVTITITPDLQVSVNTTTLTFTTGNWSVAQTVSVTAVNDAVVEGAHTGPITHSASGGGLDGADISDVVANVTDDEVASVTVTESAGSTDATEGGPTDTYDVVLDTEPSGSVTITLTPDADASVSSPTLIFATSSWDTAQTVTFTAVNDAIVEGAHTGTVTHSASGGSYDGVSISSVVASITDNDAASVTVTETGGSTDVTEGGPTDTYDVVLDLEPSGTVTVSITPDSQVTRSPTSLIFTTGNWSALQTVTVTAVDDTTVEGSHTGTITHSASGGSYDGVSIASVVANITDDDTAGGEQLEQLEYRWYTNADSASPGAALAAQDTPLAGGVEGTPYHLRMSVKDAVVDLNPGQVFKLQFAVSTGGLWTDAGAVGSGEVWRGYDNPSAADGASLPSNLLTFADTLETYEEANNSASTPTKIDVAKAGEWAWVIQANSPSPDTTYFLRMVRDTGTPLETYTVYPELAIGGVGVTITPDNTDSGTPDSVVSHTHTVTNTGAVSDTFDVSTASSAGWTVALYEADGVTPLADTDTDTIPDTGSLAPSASVNIVVKVTVGWNALSDTTSVTSTSSVDSAISAVATDTTTAPPTITLTLSDTTIALGTPDPTCEGLADGATIGEFTVYSGTTGNQGCSYVWSDLDVTVQSNKAWSGTIAGTDGSPTSGVTVPEGSFRYDVGTPTTSYAGCASNTALTTAASPFEPSGGAGDNQVYTYHHCVLVDWDDDDGTIDSTITYTVQQ